MSITLNFTPELETQVYNAAVAANISPDLYIAQLIQQHFHQPHVPRLNQLESKLLQQINLGLPQTVWQQYHQLVAKRRAETLSLAEQQTLIQITNQIEIANAQRIEALVKLATLRHTSLDNLMANLGIKSPLYV
jgi:hypothetical protein